MSRCTCFVYGTVWIEIKSLFDDNLNEVFLCDCSSPFMKLSLLGIQCFTSLIMKIKILNLTGLDTWFFFSEICTCTRLYVNGRLKWAYQHSHISSFVPCNGCLRVLRLPDDILGSNSAVAAGGGWDNGTLASDRVATGLLESDPWWRWALLVVAGDRGQPATGPAKLPGLRQKFWCQPRMVLPNATSLRGREVRGASVWAETWGTWWCRATRSSLCSSPLHEIYKWHLEFCVIISMEPMQAVMQTNEDRNLSMSEVREGM